MKFSAKKHPAGFPKSGLNPRIEPLESRVLLSATSTVQLPLLTVAAPEAITGSPTGLSPAMIQQAYDLKNIVFTVGSQSVSANGAGETIAIVDAFGDPNISSDLQTFDANFGISNDNPSGQFALTVATPEGAVGTNSGWDLEESLDVEWAHAIAPAANILLVESPSATVASLTSAVTWAASQSGVVAVSMSWGDSPEFAGETADDKDFTTPAGHAGVTFIAAAGDDAAPNYPSTSPNVLAIGGTTLTVDNSGNWLGETPWNDGGGGTSPFEGTTKPEVSYDGNPSTGFLVYDSVRNSGKSGWQVVGGTSAGTPQWSAMIALIDQGRALIGLGSLDGRTQALPEIKNLPSSDFNVITGAGLTGAGSPIGEKIISALVGGNITSVHDSGTQLIFSQQPTNRTAGANFSPAITVLVEDVDGNVVAADESNVTLSVSSGPGTLTGAATVTAVNGIATFSNLALDTSGTYTLTASDGNLAGITSNSVTVSPAAASQLVIIHQPTTVTAGATISPAVTVDIEDQFGNLITSNTSTVTLAVNTGQASLSGTMAVAAVNGVATFGNLSLGAAGAYTLKATDGSLASATSPGFTVNPVATTTTLIATSNVIAAGQVVAFIATVTAASGSPAGIVTFMDDSTLIGTVSVNSTTHQAVAFTDSLPMGLYSITATYNASGAFATSSASLSETVTAPIVTTTSLVSSTNPVTAGQVVAFTATVSAASGSPTGTVTFMDGSILIGTVALNATTHQAVAFTPLPAGSNPIIAIYNAAGGFAASSASLTQAVNAATTTTVVTSTNPIIFGQVVAFTATVSSPNGSPIGSVTFTDGSTLIGTVAVDPTTQQAVAFTGSLPVGSNKITATYNGADGFGASSASLNEIVNPGIPTTTTLVASSATINIGQVVAITATVTATSGSPTGTVTFMDGSILIGTAALDSTTHQAVAFTLSLPAGSNNLVAIYNGDGEFLPSSNSISESVESA